MEESKLTSAGQTTIPAPIRHHLNLQTGDKIRYVMDNDKVYIIPAKHSVQELKGFLPKPKKAVSLQEMDNAFTTAAVNRVMKK